MIVDHTHVPFHLGIMNCVFGVFGIILSAVAMSLPSDVLKGNLALNIVGTGEGVWCGITLIITGIFGILSKVKPSKYIYIFSGLLAITATIISTLGFAFSVIGFFVYAYIASNGTFISLYTVVGSLCLAAMPVCIVQAVFSFRAIRLNKQPEKGSIDSTKAAAPTWETQYVNLFFGLGIAEAALGFFIFIFDVIAVAISGDDEITGGISLLQIYFTGIGIWGGIYICASGALGIGYKFRQTVVMLNANMAISMLSATTSFLIGVVSALAAVIPIPQLIGLHITKAILSLFVMIICTVHSAYCCKGMCLKQVAKGEEKVDTNRVVTTTIIMEEMSTTRIEG